MPHPCSCRECCSGSDGCAEWQGRQIADSDSFDGYVRDPVRGRIRDTDGQELFAAEISALTTTDMETEFVRRLLESVHAEEPWEIGEAIAECLMDSGMGDGDEKVLIIDSPQVVRCNLPWRSSPGASAFVLETRPALTEAVPGS